MTNWQRVLPFSMFFSGLVIGVSTNLSWLPFLGFLLGVAIMAIGMKVWIFLDLRKKMRVCRPQLEQLLDEMIQLVEHPARPLEKMVLYNASRQSGGKIWYNLQVHGGEQNYVLQILTIASGLRAGWMWVSATQHNIKGKKRLGLEYPDLADFTRPEPWLIGRLDKLRALVGDVSLCEAVRQRLSVAGIIVDTNDDTDPPQAV